MAKNPLPDQAVLLKLLRYEPDTGKLFWNARTPEDFSHTKNPSAVCHSWNCRDADTEALTANHKGYRFGQVARQLVMAHRVIWKMVYGYDPDDIDHINGNRSDNRLMNLRNVTRAENLRNLSISKRNKSGVIGVALARGKWIAQIRIDGKSSHIGSFATKAEAARARLIASQGAGYHTNHGKTK